MIAKLQKQLTEANERYRRGELSPMTDQEWDDTLEQLEKEMAAEAFRQFRETLTEKAGSTGKVKHANIIGSLTKTKAEDDSAVQFVKQQKIRRLFVSSKVDGASMVLDYQYGKLREAATRGDGYVGENQTDKMSHVAPTQLKNPFTGQIRGEVVLTEEEFQIYNAANGMIYKSPRNALVGIINRKTVDPAALKHVQFIAHNILTSTGTVEERFEELRKLNFLVPAHQELTVDESTLIEDLVEIYNNYKESEPYTIDGLVISSNKWTNESRFLPTGCVAFKVNDLCADTTIIGCDWRLSKGGLMKPVFQVAPVELGGSTIRNETGNNYRYVKNSGLKIGQKVSIIKSGDIIPKIVQVHPTILNTIYQQLPIPTICPSCGGDIEVGEVDLICLNRDCSSQIQQKVNHFIRKMGVEGASLKSLQAWNINNFLDLMVFRPAVGSTSQQNFHQELQDKMFSASPEDLLANMHWEGWGSKTVKKLIEHIGFESTISGVSPTSFPEGLTLDGWYKSFLPCLPTNLNMLDYIIKDPRYSYVVPAATSAGPLVGISFCFTGAMSMKRSDLEDLAVQKGAEIRSVSKELTYLVTNDPNSGSSKNEKAQKLGIKLITEADFMVMVK